MSSSSNRVLMANGGLEEGLGGVQWELVGCLGLAWLMVYLIVWKGLHQSGKVTCGRCHLVITCSPSDHLVHCPLTLCCPGCVTRDVQDILSLT